MTRVKADGSTTNLSKLDSSRLLVIKANGPSLPNTLAPLRKNNRQRHKRQRHKPEQRVAPAKTKDIKHSRTSQGQQRTDKRPGSRQRSVRGRRVRRVTIDDISLDRHVNAHHTESEGKHPDDGHNPEDMLVGSPAIPEETNWQDAREENHHRKAHFGLKLPVVPRCELPNDAVICRRVDENAAQEAESNA